MDEDNNKRLLKLQHIFLRRKRRSNLNSYAIKKNYLNLNRMKNIIHRNVKKSNHHHISFFKEKNALNKKKIRYK